MILLPGSPKEWALGILPLLASTIGLAQAAESYEELQKASNASLLWGPYRPNLYFGVRPRIPKSLLMGLMWSRVEDYTNVQNDFRHTCEQNEGFHGYGWEEYDARSGGRQVLHDEKNGLDLTTSFVKIPGGDNGGNWGVRIKGTPMEGVHQDLKTTVVFYAAMEAPLGQLGVMNEQEEGGQTGSVKLEGNIPGALGDFAIEVTEGKGEHPSNTPHPAADDKLLDRTLVKSLQLPVEALWQTKQILFAHMKQEIDKFVKQFGEDKVPPPWLLYTIDNEVGKGNLQLVQKTFEGPFEFDILYSASSSPESITSEVLGKQIDTVTKGFSKRFSDVLKPKAPFTKGRYEEFSKSLFSNLVGGIGYFYGDQRVDRSHAPEYDEENEGFWEEAAEARARAMPELEGPSELFTSIPSRPFFPRGFLWDEGFHLLPILDWDADLTMEIVKSWFNTMDEDGWIPREQILGDEARSKVPNEFQVQYPHYANPTTLFLVLSNFVQKLNNKDSKATSQQVLGDAGSSLLQNREAALQYLKDLYPLVRRHYFWYRKTQAGDIKSYDREAFSTKEGYRWRGRTPRHILPSGLDDYPRAQPPHPGELHLDLISWIGMATRALKDIAHLVGEEDDAKELQGYETAIIRNIDDLHWSKPNKAYCDATIDDYDESIHVCHKGYISIFPLMTGMLAPDSEHLGAVLDLIEDENEMWSEFGLRSLSKNDELYGTDENYWRGPIWMNMNYLAVWRLLDIAQSAGPHKARATKLYTNLRKNLVQTVYKSWEETGFAWEQYNPETGAGQRTQHFTGWTSLVVKIMAMPDLSGKGGHDEL